MSASVCLINRETYDTSYDSLVGFKHKKAERVGLQNCVSDAIRKDHLTTLLKNSFNDALSAPSGLPC